MSSLDIRASDAERDTAVAALREHMTAGRLTLEEFAARVDETYAARTRAELELVLRELPAETAAVPAERRRRAKRLTATSASRRASTWISWAWRSSAATTRAATRRTCTRAPPSSASSASPSSEAWR